MSNSFIGGKEINQDRWVLSLVRKNNTDHAFLILEGVDEENNRVLEQAHLVIKKNTNNKKAAIYYAPIDIDKLFKVSGSCHSVIWEISSEQAKAFQHLVKSEVQRGELGLINFVISGNSKINGIVGDSLEESNLDNSKEDFASIDHPYMHALLNHGHNCYSWAYTMTQALQLPKTQESFKSAVVRRPIYEIDGTQYAEQHPRHGCTII